MSSKQKDRETTNAEDVLEKTSSRRSFIKGLSIAAAAGSAALATGCIPNANATSSEQMKLQWQEFFKKNYRLMSQEEKEDTVTRLERLSRLKDDMYFQIGTEKPVEKVLYGYAFNITRCEGFMECVTACVKENNLDRKTNTQYIRIFEMEPGKLDPSTGDGSYFHKVPVDNKFYMGTQCFHCENAPCTKACPTRATWKEPDGIVVVDYDWCIGCRYCQAACPYYGRRFNWGKPEIPKEEITTKQHYLGNRIRPKGKMEKCTFCIQRTRKGRLPACVEACPTGSRVFGNLLDPDSEIRYVLKHKKVFRMKDELGTEPKFWYFID
jgi:Fe-S-cluster-containing dehydrogenase component